MSARASKATKPPGAQPLWWRGFDALRLRAGRFGQRERSGEIDAFGFDPETLRTAERVLKLSRAPWWRSSTHGQDALHALLAARAAEPAALAEDVRPGAAEQSAGPPIFVSQPSAPPWSGLLIAERAARVQAQVAGAAAGADAEATADTAPSLTARPRFLVAQQLAARAFWQPLLARLGGIGACRENLEHVLAAGHAVVVSASARSSVRRANPELCVETLAEVALAHGSPLVPVSVAVEGLIRGMSMMPAARAALALDPLGLLPLRWRVAFGEPIHPRAPKPASANQSTATETKPAPAEESATNDTKPPPGERMAARDTNPPPADETVARDAGASAPTDEARAEEMARLAEALRDALAPHAF